MKDKKKRSIQEMVLVFADEWRMEHVVRGETGTRSVRAIVRRHLDQVFHSALDAMMGIKRTSWHEIELVHKDGASKTIIEDILSIYRRQLEKQLRERLTDGEFALTEAEEKKLRRVFRQELMDNLEEKVRGLAEEAAEKIVEENIHRIWMDDELATLVEEDLRSGG